MICVGIDVAKDKHDCFILNSEGAVLSDVFTIANNLEGFNTLLDNCGIYVGDGMMIHCGDPISYANLNSSYWQAHFYAYGRLP